MQQTVNIESSMQGFVPETAPEWSMVKDHLFLKTVNYKRNKAFVDGVPHLRVSEELAQLVYMRCKANEDSAYYHARGIGWPLLEKWRKKPGEVFDTARRSMLAGNPPVFMKLGEILGIPEDDTGLWCLTSSDKFFGFSFIFFDECIEMIKEKLGDGFYVIPSSIHEAIVFSDKLDIPPDAVKQTILHVNETIVGDADYLSDSLYHYSDDTGFIEI